MEDDLMSNVFDGRPSRRVVLTRADVAQPVHERSVILAVIRWPRPSLAERLERPATEAGESEEPDQPAGPDELEEPEDPDQPGELEEPGPPEDIGDFPRR
jgi:hypothetical protein